MSYDYSTAKNKQQKVYFQQYLYNAGEPIEDSSSDLPPELEAELLENSHFMKRRFRRIAQRLRNRYP